MADVKSGLDTINDITKITNFIPVIGQLIATVIETASDVRQTFNQAFNKVQEIDSEVYRKLVTKVYTSIINHLKLPKKSVVMFTSAVSSWYLNQWLPLYAICCLVTKSAVYVYRITHHRPPKILFPHCLFSSMSHINVSYSVSLWFQ